MLNRACSLLAKANIKCEPVFEGWVAKHCRERDKGGEVGIVFTTSEISDSGSER